jgi:succinate dehydrogenase / fumarate reductase, cytochrome b subunit
MSNTLAITLKSSVVKKQLVGITGLLLCGFLVTHLLGNFLLLVGPEAFNKYGHALTSNPLIYIAEAGLLLLFIGHMGLALKATLENRAARPQRYFMKTKTGRGSTLASSTMPYTGMILLAFIVFHLQGIKFGAVYSVTYEGVVMRDLYKLTFEKFSSLPYTLFYVVSMIAMAIHVSHGFWSAFQSVGFWHNRYTNTLRLVAIGYALFVGIGFSILPIYCFLTGAN